MRRGSCVKAGVLASAVVLLLAVPALCADDASSQPQSLEVTLEHMAGLLGRLGDELATVDRPTADRLEERVEEAAGIVEDLLASLSDEDAPRQPARTDAVLRRLIALLEDIVGGPGPQPERARARATLEGIRAWVDGYIAAATAGMNPRDAARFEHAAQDLARALASHLAGLAHRAPAARQKDGRLPQAISRLESLAQRLDELLARRAAQEDSSP
jgi:hypothetical protein